MINDLAKNYTSVCWFCGTIYQSNRSTSKYCSKKHNSLFALYGPQIKPIVNEKGEVMVYDDVLEEIHKWHDIQFEEG
jgi:hypothetical protein